jgi:hypothetical protein
MSLPPERRYRPPEPDDDAVRMPCRLCYTLIELTPDRLEETSIHVFYRCQSCGGSFPIRREDADAVKARGGGEPSEPAP